MSTLQPFGRLAGRLLLALIIIGSGFSKISGFEATAALMASKGMGAATTPTGFAILINPFSGISSTTPTVFTPAISARAP